MSQAFQTTISENGKILIPVRLRNKLALKFGQPILIKEVNNGIFISSLEESVRQAQASVRELTQGNSLMGELKKLRATDYDV